jgi:hypothetical protein
VPLPTARTPANPLFTHQALSQRTGCLGAYAPILTSRSPPVRAGRRRQGLRTGSKAGRPAGGAAVVRCRRRYTARRDPQRLWWGAGWALGRRRRWVNSSGSSISHAGCPFPLLSPPGCSCGRGLRRAPTPMSGRGLAVVGGGAPSLAGALGGRWVANRALGHTRSRLSLAAGAADPGSRWLGSLARPPGL